MNRFRAVGLGLSALGISVAAFVACGDDDAATTKAADAGVDATNTMPSSTVAPPTTTPDADTTPDSAIVDATTPADSCDGYKICENFESYEGAITNAMALGPWAATVNGVTMTVDSVWPHSGSKALHITTIADGGAPARGTLQQKPDGGVIPGNDVYGRAMVYYNNAPGFGLPIGVHSWLFSTQGTSVQADGGVSLNMGGGGTKMQLNYHFVSDSGAEQSVQGGAITTGAWHCIQWQFDGSKDAGAKRPNDENRVWLDGVLVIDAKEFSDAGGDKWPSAEPWKLFDFGFNHYQFLDAGGGDNVDVFLDDFAMNDTMVPCPAP